ncbi:hypothetical protein L2E82_23260 [Cichorium intybus]|uniref:Uncharacterized protein n=1 Tax=Cichorium intybus TaxID=13427 RepID=A0ACB9E053_CICIN|nr:hypothetical protein L2E82_23260 [Cichorium intybus]
MAVELGIPQTDNDTEMEKPVGSPPVWGEIGLLESLLEQKNGLARRIFSKAGVDNTRLLEATDKYIQRQPKVPLLLRGAFCACAWHFFYNSESLEVLVAIQGALTVIGNATMCIAAYRIYKSSQESSIDTSTYVSISILLLLFLFMIFKVRSTHCDSRVSTDYANVMNLPKDELRNVSPRVR